MKMYKAIINNIKCDVRELSVSSDYCGGVAHTEIYTATDKNLKIDLYDNVLTNLSICVITNDKIMASGFLKNFQYDSRLFYYTFDIISYKYEKYKNYSSYEQIANEIKKYNVDEILNR